MHKFRTLFIAMAIVAVVLSGFLGVALVVGVANESEIRDAFVKLMSIVGIVGAVSATVMILQGLNKR